MVVRTTPIPPDLYEADETAWLDAMAALIAEGRTAELDYAHLQEFLRDMANRDRREVESRLVVLLAHLLKWVHQPDRRSGGWKATILAQRNELRRHASSGVLRNHAIAVLQKEYTEAVELAATETGSPPSAFPTACPYTLDHLLTGDLFAE